MVNAGTGPESTGPGKSNKALILIILGAITIAVAVVLNFTLDGDGPDGISGDNRTPETAGEVSKTDSLPAFDVVRVSPNGDAVFAGRARPGSTVIILDGDREIGRVVADDRGEWVFIPNGPLEPGNRSLSLKMIDTDGTETSSRSVVALMVPEHGRTVAGGAADGESQALAVLVPKDGEGASRVLQTPGGVSGLDITVDAVDYDSAGNIIISGTTKPGNTVYLYLNNDFIGQAKADKNGAWTLKPERTIKPGLYTLRADRVDDAGKVLSRAEFPFARAEGTENLKPGSFAVVQPGNSLWRLARSTYGRGVRYTLIFEANRDKIKNPDLIYPGQVFTLPSSQ